MAKMDGCPISVRGIWDISSAAAEFFEKRKAGPRTERGVTVLNRLAKYWLVLHQIATHSPPLRTLPAHNEADARRLLSAGCESRADFRAFFFLRKRVEFLGQFRPTDSHQSQPMRVMITPGSQSISEIRQNGRTAVGIGMLLNPCAQIRRGSSGAILPNERKASPAMDGNLESAKDFSG